MNKRGRGIIFLWDSTNQLKDEPRFGDRLIHIFELVGKITKALTIVINGRTVCKGEVAKLSFQGGCTCLLVAKKSLFKLKPCSPSRRDLSQQTGKKVVGHGAQNPLKN
ncbi:hypothetical protein HanIR_Chr02g0057671 [Helianthus annuus]|nr:hypothetical protein HanIR_Chr02g0057671 [Helianthus annuus]